MDREEGGSATVRNQNKQLIASKVN